MSVGWIKIHRKMVSWEWYADNNVFKLFIHLLLTANHKDARYMGHIVPRGSRVTGLNKLSGETGLSVQELRTASEKLKSTGEITTKSTNKFSIVTICKYSEYQELFCEEQQADQQAGQQTANKPSTTSKEVKKERRKELSSLSEERFDLFWEKYPRKDGKKDALKAWEKQQCFNGSFDTIMDRVEKFKTACDGKDRQYIPLPATWIRGERWNDELVDGGKTEKIGGLTF